MNLLQNQRNKRRAAALGAVFALFWGALAALAPSAAAVPDPATLHVPPGFHIAVLTGDIDNAREMALGRFHDGRGVLYVGSFNAGRVYALELEQNRVVRTHVIADGLNLPIGVAWHDDVLYVSEVSKVVKFVHIDESLEHPPQAQTVIDTLPHDTHHGGRFLAVSADGWLYVPVGAPCNVCERPDNQYANLQRMHLPDGSLQLVARGIRNTVGFDFSPSDGSVWFTDNGRDLMGDDIPSDELNHVTRLNEHFGFPFCHAGDIADPEFGAQHACSEFQPPEVKLGAHVAALGMRFYTGSMFPEAYRGNVFIAEHGSWNRSSKVGYQVVRVPLDRDGHAQAPQVFASGWLQRDAAGHEHVSGRPADVLVMPDGALLVSDDTAGAIYRIWYQAP